MKKAIINIFVIIAQLLIIGFFFGTFFNFDVRVEEYSKVVYNKNLDKIADSVSVLFKDEIFDDNIIDNVLLDDSSLEELPSIDVVPVVNVPKEEEKKVVSTPLVSVDMQKYDNNEAMGFVVTEGNKNYSLSDYEFDVVVAVVSGEFDRNLNDALAVVSVILNRCDSDTWRRWAGDTPYKQVIRAGQFEVYFSGMYQKYMPGGSNYGDSKYEIAKQAVIDGLNGIRNNSYLGFRAWWISSYSDKYIVYGGNRYGYN